MPIPLILIILGAAAALAVVVLLIVYWDEIVEWFRKRNLIKAADKENIAFTIKKKLDDGDYQLVQGIFNKRTEEIVEGRVMQTKKLDDRLRQEHSRKELVIYE